MFNSSKVAKHDRRPNRPKLQMAWLRAFHIFHSVAATSSRLAQGSTKFPSSKDTIKTGAPPFRRLDCIKSMWDQV
ncbi:hypothetical protein NL676_030801 [Syzygium grande]|nr:hypothetical protein NL676_030801 [Syzygium grande]